MGPPAAVTEVRDRFRASVADNKIRPAHQWGRPCHGFNVHLTPSTDARAALARVQSAVADIEPTLLRCPPPTLHVSLAWLLGVQVDYPVPKSSIWSRHGDEWIAGLAAVAQRPFVLSYQWLAVTDTAVIALAAPIEPVRALRLDITRELTLPRKR